MLRRLLLHVGKLVRRGMSPKAGDGEVDTDDSDSPVCTSSIVCPLMSCPSIADH